MKKFIFYFLIFMQSFTCFSSASLIEYPCATSLEESLYLQSNEGKFFEISFEAAKLSAFVVANLNFYELSDSKTNIVDTGLDSKILSQVIALCKKHLVDETLDLDLDPQDTLDLYEAIDYLQIDALQDLAIRKIFDLIMQSPYEELASYNINFERLLDSFFLKEYRREANFKDEVRGSDAYKQLYYSIKYPIYKIERTLADHLRSLESANFSPDGTKVVTSSWDYTAVIWNVRNGKSLLVLKDHNAFLTSASFSPEGTMVVTTSYDDIAKIWDVDTGNKIKSFKGHTKALSSASFNSDATKIVTASHDHKAKVWNVSSASLIRSLEGHNNWVTSANFSSDGTKIVTASYDKTAKIWNTETGSLIFTLVSHDSSLESANFSRDGTKVVTASHDYTAKIWNVSTGELLHTLKDHTHFVNSANFSPDGAKIITASSDRTAKIWDVRTGDLIQTLEGHTAELKSATFSQDGTKIVTASEDRTAKIWKTFHSFF